MGLNPQGPQLGHGFLGGVLGPVVMNGHIKTARAISRAMARPTRTAPPVTKTTGRWVGDVLLSISVLIKGTRCWMEDQRDL